jgi:hypothetical protein
MLRLQNRLVVLLLAICVLTLPRVSHTASPVDDLYERFKVDLPTADVVVLLDASGSMSGVYGTVRQAAVGFSRALTDKERAHLRVFAAVVSDPLEGKGPEVGSRVEGFLPRTPLPGRGTDLGLAIVKGLEFLERSGASHVQTFFLLTDGLHQPRSDSPYSANFEDPHWQDLRRRGHALCRQRKVFVYGFGIGQHTDIEVLRRVFPAQNVEVVVGDATEVARALAQVRERMRREQLRQAVEKELHEGKVEARLTQATIAGTVTRFDLSLTVRNAFRHLPVRLERVKVERDGSQQIRCGVEGAFADEVLGAGGQRQGLVRGALQVRVFRWHVGETEEHYRAQFAITPVAQFVHAEALKELGFERAVPRVVPATLTAHLTLRPGVPTWMAVGLLVAAGGALLCFLLSSRRFPLEHLTGRLNPVGGTPIDLTAMPNPASIGEGDIVVTLRLVDDGKFVRLVGEWSHARVAVRRGGTALSSPAQLENGDQLTVGTAQYLVEFSSPPSRWRSKPLVVLALLLMVAAFVFVGLVIVNP